MIIRIARFLCLVLFIGLAAGCSKRVADLEQVSPEEKIVIKFSHVVAENTPKGLAAQRFATLVKERTKGRVEVQVFSNSTLYKDGEELQALQSGAVQIIAPSTSKISDIYPQWQVLDLPYAFPDEDTVHQAMNGYIGNKLYDELRQNNLLGLAFWDSGFKQMTNSVRPLRYPADFAGLTFRVMIKSQVLKRQFDLLGAHSAEGNFNDLYQTLVNHVVDGEENTISNICSKDLYNVQPYITISNHGYMGYVVLTNAGFWAGLPPDIRDILERTMSEVTDWERQQALIMNKEGLEQIASSGNVQLHYQTEAEKKEWQSRLQPIYEEFAGVIGEDLLNYVVEINKGQQ
jgi:C4-dicarboxylate-binding protein DctP